MKRPVHLQEGQRANCLSTLHQASHAARHLDPAQRSPTETVFNGSLDRPDCRMHTIGHRVSAESIRRAITSSPSARPTPIFYGHICALNNVCIVSGVSPNQPSLPARAFEHAQIRIPHSPRSHLGATSGAGGFTSSHPIRSARGLDPARTDGDCYDRRMSWKSCEASPRKRRHRPGTAGRGTWPLKHDPRTNQAVNEPPLAPDRVASPFQTRFRAGDALDANPLLGKMNTLFRIRIK